MSIHHRIPFFYGWVIVGVAFCVSFLSFGMFTYVRGIYLPHFAEAFDLTRFDITIGFTIEGIVAAAFAPLLGWALDRYSPKRILIAGLSLVVLGYFLLSVIVNVWQFYVVMAICFGLGITSLGSFTVQRLTVSWFDKRRGLALSLVILGASMSGMVMPTVTVWLQEQLGWQNSLIALGTLIAVVLYPLTMVLLKDDPESIGVQPDGTLEPSPVTGPVLTTREILTRISFWSIVFVFGAILCVFTTVTMHGFSHAKDLGLTDYQAAGGIFAMSLCAALGKPVVGILTDYVGVRPSIWFSLVMLSVGLWSLAQANTFTGVVIGFGAFGLGYAGMLPLRSYAVAATVGQRSFGLANGWINLSILPLTLSASPMAAFVYDFTGSYALAFQLLVGLMALAAVGPFFIVNRQPSS